MKILFFSHDSGLYGASRSMVNIIQGLQNLGVYCKVIIPNRGQLESLLQTTKIEYCIMYYPWWTNSIGVSTENDNTKGIFSFLSKVKGRYKEFIKIIKPVLNKNNRKEVKGFDLIISNTSVIATGFFFALYLRLPHVWFIREFGDLDFGLKFNLGDKLTSKIFRRSELIVYNSLAVANHYARIYKIKAKQSIILQNGLFFKEEFIDKKNQRALKEKRTDHFVFCIIGSVTKSKGQWDAVNAIAELKNEFPNIRLWIIGSGAIEELKNYVSKKGLENFVVFFGFIEDVNSFFLEMDCLLVCSKHEAFGRTTVEAMAFGIPVIGNDSGGTSEIIEHDKTGLLYPGDLQGLILCMKRIITEQDLTTTLGKNGWNMAFELFNIENFSQKFFNEIKKYIKE